MLFEIRHVTQYHYDAPVRESMVEVRMRPRQGGGQNLISFELETDPLAQVLSYVDNWGNLVHHFDVPHAHQRLEIIATSMVEAVGRPDPPASLAMDEWDALQSEAVRGEFWDFLAMTGRVAHTPALEAFIKGRTLGEPKRVDPLTAVRGLCATLYEAFDYEAGITGADSSIDHALIEGRGVCQDFAHIMIAICRGWGVPARYVSGYLCTDPHDRSTSRATHAWVEVYAPSLGWVGFDPTNNVLAGERHLAAAVGRDYADVPPSRGVFKGKAESHLSVGVAVRKSSQKTARGEFPRMGAPTLTAARRRAAAMEHQQQQQQ